jgi:hypothetical protein
LNNIANDKMRPMSKNSHNHSGRPGNGLHNPHEIRDGYNQKENGVPVPGMGGFRNGMMGGAPNFEMARSPPGGSNKSAFPNSFDKRYETHQRADTRHVPCKFFRQGACQAGNACPFSHSLDPLTHQAPCKYFSKAGFPAVTNDLDLMAVHRVIASSAPNVLLRIISQMAVESIEATSTTR